MDPEDIEARLARLAGATSGLRASSGFSARVMAAIHAEAAPSFLHIAWFSARRMLPVAALATALAVGWAVQSDNTVDDAIASSYASVGFE